MTVRHFIQREGEGETGKGHFSLTNLLTFRIGGCISDLLECVQEGSQHDDCVPGRKKRCNEGPDVILSEEDNNFMEILSRTYLIAPCSFPALLTNSSRLGTPTCNKQMGDQSWRIEIDENVSLKYLSLGTSYERAAQNVVPPPLHRPRVLDHTRMLETLHMVNSSRVGTFGCANALSLLFPLFLLPSTISKCE